LWGSKYYTDKVRVFKKSARLLGVSCTTVRRRLRAEDVPVAAIRARKPTKLDGYRGYLQARIASARPEWIPATVLFEEIKKYRGQAYFIILKM